MHEYEHIHKHTHIRQGPQANFGSKHCGGVMLMMLMMMMMLMRMRMMMMMMRMMMMMMLVMLMLVSVFTIAVLLGCQHLFACLS